MDELVRWLGEQLDEDERIVQEALRYVDADWQRDSGENVVQASGATAAGQQPVDVTADRWRRPMVDSPAVVAHVAEHDPARVLREIKAKRQILKMAEEATQQAESRDYLVNGPAKMMLVCLKPVLLHLATAYADRPGYRGEWRI
ncbi:DUF6221 family protein [Streptomyces sp. NPDC057837]|uniref:DUF6221 family protein n=1 Tax=Streptomyces sp. NPDC057837 TaxID=3346260 RepID=UPI0036C0694F